MAWDVAMSGILLAAAAIMLKRQSSSVLVDQNRNARLGFAASIGVCGLYLFLSGISISITWPFSIANGVYNVLFGGIATIGGVVLLAGSAVGFLNADLRPVSYLAALAGLYSVVDAYSILSYGLTNAPLLSALGYLSFAAPAFLSVPVAHSDKKVWQWLFVISALLFAIAWLYQAATFTILHLQP